MRDCLEGHFIVSLLHVLIWEFFTKYGNINSVLHSDKKSADSKYLGWFVREMILWFPWKY